MLKKLTIISGILLSNMYAFDVESSDELGNLMQRVVYVENFKRIAEEAAADTSTIRQKNEELVNSFNAMATTLGNHRLINLCYFETKKNAENTAIYYKNVKTQLFTLMEIIANQSNLPQQ